MRAGGKDRIEADDQFDWDTLLTQLRDDMNYGVSPGGAASFATSGHARWLCTLAWMPSRCSLAAISSRPEENMFSTPRIR